VRCVEEEMSPETHTASTEEVVFSYVSVKQKGYKLRLKSSQNRQHGIRSVNEE